MTTVARVVKECPQRLLPSLMSMSKLTPKAALDACHADIRQGTFTPELLDTVRDFRAQWERFTNSSLKHLGAVVSAEVLDHYGHYLEAAKALSEYEVEETIRLLKRTRMGPEMKRLLWLVLGHAHTHYRAEQYSKTRSLLTDCLNVLDTVDPARIHYLGTRARVSSAMGQVLRQLGEYDGALHHFDESIRVAQERFRQKTPAAEFTNPDQRMGPTLSDEAGRAFEASRKLAHWTIAKSLALGTGWIHYVTGRLTDASICLSTGAALLRPTQDSVHRAYCQLLMSSVERAKHADNPERLLVVLTSMKDAAHGLSKHPLFRVRSYSELAVAYLHLGDLAAAEDVISKVARSLSKASDTGYRSHRWQCSVSILKSRLQRARGDAAGAERYAQDALKHARGMEPPTQEIEALIAWSEALRQQGSATDLELAVGHLEKARDLASANPKTAAVCTLHLAAVSVERGRHDRAQSELKRWHLEYEPIVEHGFVRGLASKIESRLWSSDDAFKLKGTKLDVNWRLLQMHLFEIVNTPGARVGDKASNLGISVKQYNRLKKQLKDSPPQ